MFRRPDFRAASRRAVRTPATRLITSLVVALALLAGSAAAFLVLAPADPPSKPYDLAKDAPVLIVLGQSNAEGWTVPLTDADRAKCQSLDNVKGLSRADHRTVGATAATWSRYTCAGNNLGLEHGTEPKVGYNHHVASVTALRWQRAVEAGAKLPDLNVIHIAWGSQGVLETEVGGNNRWWPDRDPTDIESLFPLAMNTIGNGLRALQEDGKRPRIIGIHWNQWEAEAKNAGTTVDGLKQAFLKVLNPLRTITGDTGAPIFLYRPRSVGYDKAATLRTKQALEEIAVDPPYKLLDTRDATALTFSADHTTSQAGAYLYTLRSSTEQQIEDTAWDAAPPQNNFGIFTDTKHYTTDVHTWLADQQWKTVFADGKHGAPVRATSNAALSKSATQSSTYTTPATATPPAVAHPAGLAADGDRSAGTTSFSATSSEPQPWWQVDLGATKQIRSVELFDRTDGDAERLANLYVMVSPTDLTGRTVTGIEADPTVRTVRVTGTVPTKLTLPVGADGRYVRVQLAGTGSLTLAEVQVNVPATPDR
ncbi:discoidin domain-containing protein [Kitasatospora purpeofusca]|uniref:discoidin domain-containing protein n=1 Tax=Kitasatospora purpeofusca TaxID=67352 RepID=UPI0035DBA792